jgi:hypothetical protein
MAARMQNADPAFADDMHLVRDMIHGHERIKRTVNNLPNGIRTVTESDDPHVAQTIKAHVASMEQRLNEGRIFNLFSPTLPVLFENKDRIKTQGRRRDADLQRCGRRCGAAGARNRSERAGPRWASRNDAQRAGGDGNDDAWSAIRNGSGFGPSSSSARRRAFSIDHNHCKRSRA